MGMSRYVVLHDRRLAGRPAMHADGTLLQVDGKTSVQPALGIISALGRLDGRQLLYVLCHGFAGSSAIARQCGDYGGMGLQLGKENVLHRNVAQWTALRGAVSMIVVYACGAADTEPNARGTEADGRYLMGALAIHTGATVYAADRIQWYTTGRGTIDFGAWEGTLFEFNPNGLSRAVPGNRVPIELGDVT